MRALEGLSVAPDSETTEVVVLSRVVKSASLVFDLREETLWLPAEHIQDRGEKSKGKIFEIGMCLAGLRSS